MLNGMRTSQNSRGFAALELILVLVVVAIIGFTGWYVWNARKTTDKSDTTPTTQAQVNKEVAKVDAYADWKTCSDPVREVSIKYPADWENTSENMTPCTQYQESAVADKIFEVLSPKNDQKLFRVWYLPGDQYNTDTASDLLKVISVDTVTTAAGKKLNLIGYADQYNEDQSALSGIALTDQNLAIGKTFRGYPTITASNGKMFAVNATLTQDDGGDAESYTYSVYKQQASYQDVLKMLQSVVY